MKTISMKREKNNETKYSPLVSGISERNVGHHGEEEEDGVVLGRRKAIFLVADVASVHFAAGPHKRLTTGAFRNKLNKSDQVFNGRCRFFRFPSRRNGLE